MEEEVLTPIETEVECIGSRTIIKPDPTSEQIDELSEKLGLVSLSEKFVLNLSKLGENVEALGITRFAQGTSTFNIQAMGSIIAKLQARAMKSENIKELKDIAYAIGYVADKLTRANKAMVTAENEHVEQVRNAGAKKHLATSFQPGAACGPVVNVGIVVSRDAVQTTAPEKP